MLFAFGKVHYKMTLEQFAHCLNLHNVKISFSYITISKICFLYAKKRDIL